MSIAVTQNDATDEVHTLQRRLNALEEAFEALVGFIRRQPSLPAGAGFWATCARSIASSSGGTSLHGSLELRGAVTGSRSWRPLDARSLLNLA